MPATNKAPDLERPASRNRFNRMEWAGAFGDLGRLIPFVVAYISLLKMDPYGILLAFGIAKIVSGIYYQTPFPIQPMKAIGAVATTQAAQTIVITANAVYGVGIVTGIIWLVLGATGATKKVAELVSRPVAVGIIVGLGFGFMLEGIKMMATGWVLGGLALLGTMLLLTGRDDRFVSIVTAACAIWNIGLAFVFGVLTYQMLKRGWMKL